MSERGSSDYKASKAVSGKETEPLPSRDKIQKRWEKLSDPFYLPKRIEIKPALPEFYDGKDVLEYNSEFTQFCLSEENPIYEFLNEEFIAAFSDYLVTRAESLGASKTSPVTILEVGAGNGRMSHFIQQKLESKLYGRVRVVATDAGTWKIRPIFPVEILDQEKAIKKYQPKIIICSWMPNGKDFTRDFRAAESVDEYILIGDNDITGDQWATWGKSALHEEDEGGESQENEGMEQKHVASYIADGFEDQELDAVRKHQICRIDQLYNAWGGRFHSTTVSFKRKK